MCGHYQQHTHISNKMSKKEQKKHFTSIIFKSSDCIWEAIHSIIACSNPCDLFFVNSVNTGSKMTQCVDSEQCLLEGQEEKEQNQMIDLILHHQQVDGWMTSPPSVDNGTRGSWISSTVKGCQDLLQASKYCMLLCWHIFTSLKMIANLKSFVPLVLVLYSFSLVCLCEDLYWLHCIFLSSVQNNLNPSHHQEPMLWRWWPSDWRAEKKMPVVLHSSCFSPETYCDGYLSCLVPSPLFL